jgi:hypothetical protein
LQRLLKSSFSFMILLVKDAIKRSLQQKSKAENRKRSRREIPSK